MPTDCLRHPHDASCHAKVHETSRKPSPAVNGKATASAKSKSSGQQQQHHNHRTSTSSGQQRHKAQNVQGSDCTCIAVTILAALQNAAGNRSHQLALRTPAATAEMMSLQHFSDWPSCSLHWRDLVAPAAAARNMLLEVPLASNFYQFGVAGGDSVLALCRTLRPSAVVGFDSFAGLPLEPDVTERVPAWSPGAYAADPRLKLAQEQACANASLSWVAGYYNESLADPNLAKNRSMQPAAYVDIDVDLHTSAKDTLGFLLTSGLLVPGSLVGYDDWWILACAGRAGDGGYTSPLEVGEGRAHAEASRKWQVEFLCVAGPCDAAALAAGPCTPYASYRGMGVVFLVLSVGVRADPGFSMSPAEGRRWAAANPVCRHHRNLVRHDTPVYRMPARPAVDSHQSHPP